MALSPEAKAQVEASERDRRTGTAMHRALADTRFGPRTFGDLTLITEGCEVFALEHADHEDDLEHVRLNHRGEGRGGIVLAVTDQVDINEDGEAIFRRAFRTWDYSLGEPSDPRTYSTLTEAQVDTSRLCPPDTARLKSVARRFATDAVRQLNKRGPLMPETTELLRVAHLLASVVTGGRS